MVCVSHGALQRGVSGRAPADQAHLPLTWGRRSPAVSGRTLQSEKPAWTHSEFASLESSSVLCGVSALTCIYQGLFQGGAMGGFGPPYEGLCPPSGIG